MRGRVVLVIGLVAVLVGVVAAGVVSVGDGGGAGDRIGAPGDAMGSPPVDSAERPPTDTTGDPASDSSGDPPLDERDRGSDADPGAVPVLLVPGWLDTARDLAALRIRLIGAGWPRDFVETITFEEPTGSNRIHADELARAVDELLERTGAEEVDIVAHSMGGLATRWYLLRHPGAPVRRVAFLGSPHRGTLAAHLAWGEGRQEMMPDSPFLDTLNAEAPAPEGVDAVTVRTTVDTHIVPGESATLPGVPDRELCCPTHPGLIRDEEVFEILLDFLEDDGGAAVPGRERDVAAGITVDEGEKGFRVVP